MSMQPASTTRALRYLPLLVLVLLAGCGSSQSGGDAGKPGVAGVEAAARNFVTNVQSAHYKEACEGFTAQAQAILKREEPGGCLGSLPFLYGALSGQVNKFFEKVVPKLEVREGQARLRKIVYAHYEHGRWHLETAIL
jgi:hypothetical protein